MSRVGFIGLGMMGRPMAERLVESGFDVKVNDANPALAAEFGERWAASPVEACTDVDFVVTMLPNGQIVREVLVGSGAAAAMAPGTVVIDTSSSAAAGTVELGRELADLGIALVDAPVSGGVPLAKQGKLSLMVGCPDDALFDKVKPVLEAVGGRIVRVGALGSGHAVKAINNVIAAGILALTAEGVVMGERFGIDPAVLLEVINSSSGKSGVSEGLFPSKILSGTFDLGFAMALMTKDAGLADELRESLDLDLPMIANTRQRWIEALAGSPACADCTEYYRFVKISTGG